MTTRMTRLIEDARQAGYEVAPAGTATRITKRVGRWRKVVGLMIYDDGTAFDLGVERLDLAKGLRSYKDMRAVLNIQPEGTGR